MPADIGKYLRTSANSGLGLCAGSSYSSNKALVSSAVVFLPRMSPAFWEVVTGEGDQRENLWVRWPQESPRLLQPAILQGRPEYAWGHFLVQARGLAQRVPPLTTSACRGQQVTPSCTRATPKFIDESGWVLLGTYFLHVPKWWVISINGFSHIIFYVGWSQPRKVLFSSLLTSIPSFPEFPSSPRAPCLWSQHSPSCPLHFHFCFFTSLLKCIATLIGKLKRKRYEEQQKSHNYEDSI